MATRTQSFFTPSFSDWLPALTSSTCGIANQVNGRHSHAHASASCSSHGQPTSSFWPSTIPNPACGSNTISVRVVAMVSACPRDRKATSDWQRGKKKELVIRSTFYGMMDDSSVMFLRRLHCMTRFAFGSYVALQTQNASMTGMTPGPVSSPADLATPCATDSSPPWQSSRRTYPTT